MEICPPPPLSLSLLYTLRFLFRRETLRVLQLQEALLPLRLLQLPHQQQEVHQRHLIQRQAALGERQNPDPGSVAGAAHVALGPPHPDQGETGAQQAPAGAAATQSDQDRARGLRVQDDGDGVPGHGRRERRGFQRGRRGSPAGHGAGRGPAHHGLMSPISINLADLQNALKVAVDGNVIRQVLENNAKGQGQVNSGLTTGMLHPAQQQLISAISLPIVGQDGNAKIIINYSLDPNQGQLTAYNLKKEPEPTSPGQTAADTFKSQKLPEDLTIRGTKPYETTEKEEKTTKTCLLCDNCPGGLEALHALKHCKKDGLRLNGAGLDKSESAVAALLSEGGLCNQPKNLLSLLKAYFALNAEPTKDELAKISDSVSLPVHVVKKWFDKMQEGQISLGAPTPPSEEEDTCEANGVVSLVPGKDKATMSPSVTQDSPTEATPAEANGARSSPASPSPLNLTAGGPVPAQPPRAPRDPWTCRCQSPQRGGGESGGQSPRSPLPFLWLYQCGRTPELNLHKEGGIATLSHGRQPHRTVRQPDKCQTHQHCDHNAMPKGASH